MKLISFGNLKGGSGKTSIAFNIIGLLAKRRKKVLVIDCDGQANMTNNFGVDDFDESLYFLNEIFDDKDIDKVPNPANLIIKKPIENMPTVDLIPCNIFLTASEIKLASYSAREYHFKRYIEKYSSIFSHYDYIILDTAPSLGMINNNIFLASDDIVLVSDVGIHGYKGCKLIMKIWQDLVKDLHIANPNITNNIHGIVINRYDKRIKLSSQFADFIRESEDLNAITFDTFIPENVKVRESEAAGIPLAYYDTKNPAIVAYISLYKEMERKGIL